MLKLGITPELNYGVTLGTDSNSNDHKTPPVSPHKSASEEITINRKVKLEFILNQRS